MEERKSENDEVCKAVAEEKSKKRDRVNSVKDSYSHQSSFDEESSSESTDLDTVHVANKKIVVMENNRQIKELQTLLWDKNTSRADFIFHADRLIRLATEEGLNQLPFKECSVTTHTGAEYKGCEFYKGICGVSIVRSGEAMEKGLRECCRGIRIGKVLMSKDEETNERQIIYARFPPDIHNRKVFLMYPLLMSGGNVTVGVDALVDYGVETENIFILTLFATPRGINTLFKKHPNVLLLTTEIHDDVPSHFGEKYYGTG